MPTLRTLKAFGLRFTVDRGDSGPFSMSATLRRVILQNDMCLLVWEDVKNESMFQFSVVVYEWKCEARKSEGKPRFRH